MPLVWALGVGLVWLVVGGSLAFEPTGASTGVAARRLRRGETAPWNSLPGVWGAVSVREVHGTGDGAELRAGGFGKRTFRIQLDAAQAGARKSKWCN